MSTNVELLFIHKNTKKSFNCHNNNRKYKTYC